jgi:hypothetical protein
MVIDDAGSVPIANGRLNSAIGRGFGGVGDAYFAAGAGSVLDHEL